MLRIVDRFVLNAHDNTEANANPTNTPVLKENSNFIGRNRKTGFADGGTTDSRSCDP